MERDTDTYSEWSRGSPDYVENIYCDSPDGPMSKKNDVCLRCTKKVYPTERVDFGLAMHKTCFRCGVCDVTLSQNSFVIARAEQQDTIGVYCKTHAPKASRFALDDQSIEIRGAVMAQKLGKTPSFNKQIRLSSLSGWEYDPKAMEFEHAKLLHLRNKMKRPPSSAKNIGPDDVVEEENILAKLQDEDSKGNVKDIASNIGRLKISSSDEDDQSSVSSSGGTPRPRRPPGMVRYASSRAGDRAFRTEGDKEKSVNGSQPNGNEEVIYEVLNVVRTPGDNPPVPPPRDATLNQLPPPTSLPPPLPATGPHGHAFPVGMYSAPSMHSAVPSGAMEHMYHNDAVYRQMMGIPCYENLPFMMAAGMAPIHHPAPMAPRYDSHLNAPDQFLLSQSFMMQNELELRQRHEHSEMLQELTRMREQQICLVEADIKERMERAVQDLLKQMEKGQFTGDLQAEKMRIENHFRAIKEEKIKGALDSLSHQERMRIDDIVDKQAKEMLQLLDDRRQPVEMPKPEPPTKKKLELYSGPQFFDEIDFHAIQVAQREQGSFTELVYELTHNCNSQLEKARAIFRWITVKDLNKMMFSEELSAESPYYYLKAIKYGLESYHELLKRLCSYAGLAVKIIQGISKSAGYRPGMFINDNNFRNSWTCLHIDGSWRFIDCHWGARHVTDSRDVDYIGNFQYELDEFFFLTDPEDHVYMHFPDDPAWQLLRKPITKDAFMKLPVVKSSFFHYGLTFAGSNAMPPAVIETDSGSVELVLGTSDKIPVAFNTRLEAENTILDGYCIHHFSSSEEVVFNLCLPEVGTYYFTVFACDIDKGDTYNNVCSFKIKCSHVSNKPFCKFPKLPHGYGPTLLSKELGMATEKYTEPYLVCNDDKMILNIRFKKNVKVSHRIISGRFEEYSESLNRLVFQRFRDPTFVSFLLRFPERGIYLFSVFAAKEESEKPILECAYRYLIQVNVNPKTAMRIYPKIQQNWLRCRLHEPTAGELKPERNVRFKLEVGDADAVAVIIGNQWQYLTRNEETKLWEGIIYTGREAGRLAEVYARYKSNARDFLPLLEYNIVDTEH